MTGLGIYKHLDAPFMTSCAGHSQVWPKPAIEENTLGCITKYRDTFIRK